MTTRECVKRDGDDMYSEKCEQCGDEFEFHDRTDPDPDEGHFMKFVRFAYVTHCECWGPEIDYSSGVRWEDNHMVCDDCCNTTEDI